MDMDALRNKIYIYLIKEKKHDGTLTVVCPPSICLAWMTASNQGAGEFRGTVIQQPHQP